MAALTTKNPKEAIGPDDPSRRRGVVVAATIAGSAGIVAVRDPNISGSYGFCPFQALTGLDCPFCGGLRGTHALLQGDVAAALDYNVLLPFLLAAAVGGLLLWWRGSLLGLTRAQLTNRWVVASGVGVLLAFWVLRMLPVFPYLSSNS